MEAVVVQPSVRDFYFTPHRAAALGAHRVAEFVGADVINLPLSARRPRNIEMPSELEHLQPSIMSGERGPTSFFTQFHRYGPPEDVGAGQILALEPDRVFISSFAFCYAAEAIGLAAALRRARPQLWIGVGGPGPSVWPEYYARTSLFDAVYAGEVEALGRAFPPESHPGRSVSRGTDESIIRAISTGGLAAEPTWALVKETADNVLISLSVTRGCPERCAFCSNHLTHGRSFRVPDWHTITHVLDKVGDAAAGRTLRLNVEDDNILYAKDLLERIAEYFAAAGVTLSLTAENGLDYRLLDEAKVTRLSELGLRKLNLSLAVEKGLVQQSQRRHTESNILSTVLDAAARLGIEAVTYFICGLPGQSTEEVASTLRLLRRLPTQIGISLYYPVRGLPESPDDELLSALHPRVTAGSSAYPWAELSTSELVTAFRIARFLNLEKRCESELSTHIGRTGRLLTQVRGSGELLRPPAISEELEDLALC